MSKVHASLFSGFGGADLAAHWVGWKNAFWCEIDGFCRQVLRYWFPNSIGYENIKETDFRPWRGIVDVLTGGFPCQPFSVAGQRKGAADNRYLWPEMLRAIREIKPTWVIGENVAGILSMVQPASEITVESQASLFEAADKETLLEEEYVVETVCRDLEEEGYSVQPLVIPACAVGAPHRRDRVWFVANRVTSYADCNGNDRFSGNSNRQEKDEKNRKKLQCEIARFSSERIVAFSRQESGTRVDSHANRQRCEERHPLPQPTKSGFGDRLSSACRCSWREFPTQSPVCRGNDGFPFDVVRLTLSLNKWRERAIKGYGNAIVPRVIYEIFKAIETIR